MPSPSRIIDITLGPGQGAPAWPGDAPFSSSAAKTFERDGHHTSTLTLSAHAGTHVDAPGHMIPGAPLLDAFGPERFVLPALVLDAGPGPLVGPEVVAACGLAPGEALLLKTDNSARGLATPDGSMRTDFTALSPDAARAAVAAGASLVGIDAPSADPFDSEDVPAHMALLGSGVLILEWLDLSAAAPGRYLLCCPPLRLPGVEASPVRALLLAFA